MAAQRELDLSDEVEGPQGWTADIVFRLAGDPIPLLPASAPHPLYDLQSPPARPLAVSDRHAAFFLAHPNGFMAVRTNALIDASKEARAKGKASTGCALDCCVADVPLPGVSLLALSRDESVLAACTGSEIHFFSPVSLLSDEDVQPSSSCSLGQSGSIKDFKWLNHEAASYLVLSNIGLLSQGSLGKNLMDVMTGIDAVDCCKDGIDIVVARENSLRILSSDLKETCCMTLLFQLWPDDSHSEDTNIKVDSIGWVRDDTIIIGCVQLNEECKEEKYVVQVIRSQRSSKPIVFTYVDFFQGIVDDVLPSGVGPNLLLEHLPHWDLMVVSNKKSTKDPFALLNCALTTKLKIPVVYLDVLEDEHSPRIDLQENGDANVIVGFGVGNVPPFQKIAAIVGTQEKEVAPQHILLCLTSEGKVIIYYLARKSLIEEEKYDSWDFKCSVCYGIYIQPVVAECGHIFCSRCMYEFMNPLRNTRCPLCNSMFRHFPKVCETLYSLLMKVIPTEYKTEEIEILANEQMEQNMFINNPDRDILNSKNYAINKMHLQDELCISCHKLLYKPLALKCGHVYCQSCLSYDTEINKCVRCGSVSFGALPKVCLGLEQVLEKLFPSEYAARSKEVPGPFEFPSLGNVRDDISQEGAYASHLSVGCDNCGVDPVKGNRYRCVECRHTKMGYDLCERCFEQKEEKLVERFQQGHTSEHRMRLDTSLRFYVEEVPPEYVFDDDRF